MPSHIVTIPPQSPPPSTSQMKSMITAILREQTSNEEQKTRLPPHIQGHGDASVAQPALRNLAHGTGRPLSRQGGFHRISCYIMHAGDLCWAKFSPFVLGTVIWRSKSRQRDNHLQLWFCNCCVFPDSTVKLKTFKSVCMCLYRFSYLPKHCSWLSPQAGTLYVIHYKIRPWSRLPCKAQLHHAAHSRFGLPARQLGEKQAAHVLCFTPSPEASHSFP